jgi:hypothetical protein
MPSCPFWCPRRYRAVSFLLRNHGLSPSACRCFGPGPASGSGARLKRGGLASPKYGAPKTIPGPVRGATRSRVFYPCVPNRHHPTSPPGKGSADGHRTIIPFIVCSYQCITKYCVQTKSMATGASARPLLAPRPPPGPSSQAPSALWHRGCCGLPTGRTSS